MEKEPPYRYPPISTGVVEVRSGWYEKNEEESWIEKNPLNMVARSTSTLGRIIHEFLNHLP
jgi:hypothetical protein